MNFLKLSIAVLFLSLPAMSDKTKAKTECENDTRYEEVSLTDLKDLNNKKEVFLVDVNNKESYAERHIGEAIHYASVKEEFSKKLPAKKDALIVAYCGGPKCVAWKQAAKAACALGYTNVKHFKGGISGWKKEG